MAQCPIAKTAGWTGSPSGLHRRKCPRLQGSRSGALPACPNSCLHALTVSYLACPATVPTSSHTTYGTPWLSSSIPLSSHVTSVPPETGSLLSLMLLSLPAPSDAAHGSLPRFPFFLEGATCPLTCPQRCTWGYHPPTHTQKHRHGNTGRDYGRMMRVNPHPHLLCSHHPYQDSPVTFTAKDLCFFLAPGHQKPCREQEAREFPPGISLQDDGRPRRENPASSTCI